MSIEITNPNQAYSPSGIFSSSTNLAANSPVTIVSSAANINGIIVYRATVQNYNLTSMSLQALISRQTPPASIADGNMIMIPDSQAVVSGNYWVGGKLDKPIYIPPGFGLYYLSTLLTTVNLLNVHYTIL